MRYAVSLLLWCALTAGLAGLYQLEETAPPEDAFADGQTPLVLLTEDGPRQTTMADWLPFALAAEMPASFGGEALKAQAVALRTLALAGGRHADANVCTSAGCCAAWLDEPALRARWQDGYEENMAALRDAAAATDGEYLTYGGQPIQAAFHSSSAGCTEDSGAIWSPLPYLVSVFSPETEQDVPDLVSTVTVPAEEFARTLDLDTALPPERWLGPLAQDAAGRTETLLIAGTAYTGSQIRSLFSLRSTAFTVEWDGQAFVFTVSGYGHGVGMSQYGARAFAAMGIDYRHILAHYYPGTAIAVWSSAGAVPAGAGPA